MHANADVAFQLREASALLGALAATQHTCVTSGHVAAPPPPGQPTPAPRPSPAAAPAGSADARLAALCADIASQLPPDLDLGEAAPGLFARCAAGGRRASLSVVLAHEVACYRRLAGVVRGSLAQLAAAMRGQVVMSEALEACYAALLANQVCARGRCLLATVQGHARMRLAMFCSSCLGLAPSWRARLVALPAQRHRHNRTCHRCRASGQLRPTPP
jgi:hypothetical protein